MEYLPHIFYNVNKLDLQTKTSIITDAIKDNITYWVDELDVSKSVVRKPIEMSFEDVMKKFNTNCHFVVIHRRGYENNGEVGFSTMNSDVDYFLWIKLKVEDLHKIVKKYNLEIL